MSPRVAYGVFCTEKDVDLRNVLRETWIAEARQVAPALHVFFVVAAPSPSRPLLEENATHGDILALPVPEAMNKGKSFWWFDYMSRWRPIFHHVVKTDLDTVPSVKELAAEIALMPRERCYAGLALGWWDCGR